MSGGSNDGRESSWSRRRLVRSGLAGGATLLAFGLGGARRGVAQVGPPVVSEADWAKIVRLGEGAWAVISKPRSGNMQTLCNGGIVAGDERVLVVDAFAGAEGATWVADQAEALCGRAPSDVVLTHFHGDHVGGLEGFDGEVAVWATITTRDLVSKDSRLSAAYRERLEAVRTIGEDMVVVDLGGREARLVPRRGHTPSDVTIELDGKDGGITFFGDLLWNGLFPNYRDAVPLVLEPAVRAALEERPAHSVPGHGELPGGDQIELYLALLAEVEEVARRGHAAGTPAGEVAAAYSIPERLGEWFLFSPAFLPTAISVWYEALRGG